MNTANECVAVSKGRVLNLPILSWNWYEALIASGFSEDK
ncbi:MAG: hypothetical protein JWL81_796 [Verrucomicrobiales bacterium]|nr:hypothetical protein [Verrucomicrobiales bacterium]